MNQNEPKKQGKNWALWFLAAAALFFGALSLLVYKVDPMLHFHAPDAERFDYKLGTPFESNGGVLRSLDYDSLIVGTSMAGNFRPSLAQELFGGTFVKTIFHGGAYQETDQMLGFAYERKGTLHTVIRSLDTDLLEYPDEYYQGRRKYYKDYGFGTSLWADLSYILDRDIVYTHCLPMLINSMRGEPGGMISMDDYENWQEEFVYGSGSVLSNRTEPFAPAAEEQPLLDSEREAIRSKLEQYVLNQVKAHPETQFYLFFPPYSAAWWGGLWEKGGIRRELEIERLVMECLLPYDNVYLFSWNAVADVTVDLNNYKDPGHYAQWVNDWMLLQMKNGSGLLTQENYLDDLEAQRELYENLDYNGLFLQEDPEGSPVPAFFADQGIQ